jgi:hypothetical protein
VWGLFDINVALNQIVDPGGTMCFGACGAERARCCSTPIGSTAISAWSKRLTAVLRSRCGHNLQRGSIRHSQAPGRVPASRTAASAPSNLDRRLQGGQEARLLLSNKLAFVGPLLTGDEKLKHEGMELWTKVMAGDPKAQAKMQRYCSQDVRLLERVYERVKPYIPNHPHLRDTSRASCGACGSAHMQSRGYRRTKASRIQSLQCMDCGSWQQGKVERIAA